MPDHVEHIAAYYYHRVHTKIYAYDAVQNSDWDTYRWYKMISIRGRDYPEANYTVSAWAER